MASYSWWGSNSTYTYFNSTWYFPPEADLNFDASNKTICDAAGAWFAEALNLNRNGDPFISLDYIYNYTGAILPLDYQPPDTIYDLVFWYEGIQRDNGSLSDKLWYFPYENCSQQICKNLEWTGDPDVSGIGMMITYYLALGMATVYFLSLAFYDFRNRRPPTGKSKGVGRAWSSIEQSAVTFQDSLLVFAASIMAATSFRLAQALLQNFGRTRGHWQFYSLIGGMYVSMISALPAVALQMFLHGDRMRWNGLRVLLWTAITVLLIANEDMYEQFFWHVSFADPTPANESETVWLFICSPQNFLGYGIVPIIYLAEAIIFAFPGISTVGRRIKKKFQLGMALFSILLGWVLLGMFQAYRTIVDDKAGDDNQNGYWTFGQVLSLGTLFPAVVEFSMLFIFRDTENQLSTKLSKSYKVVPNTSHVEMQDDALYSLVEYKH
ncbi:hypothetical protein F4780DRAFT_792227 [Xylariomycetidae sp. FL0641]|nr:hypothetical protein F4780DRAFT_792227 [Xylariomycetidae sp. FL0641]